MTTAIRIVLYGLVGLLGALAVLQEPSRLLWMAGFAVVCWAGVAWLRGLVADGPVTPTPKRRRRTSAVKAHEDGAEHKARRKSHWAHRMPQMLEAAHDRPYWQFRVAGDDRDPPACKLLDGHIERYDAEFWKEHSPARCRKQFCRCTIRSYSAQDLVERGLNTQGNTV